MTEHGEWGFWGSLGSRKVGVGKGRRERERDCEREGWRERVRGFGLIGSVRLYGSIGLVSEFFVRLLG